MIPNIYSPSIHHIILSGEKKSEIVELKCAMDSVNRALDEIIPGGNHHVITVAHGRPRLVALRKKAKNLLAKNTKASC